jgi:hypothetical protein
MLNGFAGHRPGLVTPGVVPLVGEAIRADGSRDE